MNLSFPSHSITGSTTQLAENTLASGAKDPNQLGFSRLLSDAIKTNETAIGDANRSDVPTVGEQPANDDLTSKAGKDAEQEKLREAFHNFVGQTFFSQMLASLRSTQEGAAYFNGGQAEKIFQGQLDQVLSEELTKSSADQIADPMFELFQLQRSR